MSATRSQLDLIFAGKPDPAVTQLTGKQLRDFGIEDALQRAIRVKNDYVTSCLEAIKSFPSGSLITSEDVREKAGDPPIEVDRSVLAGIMKHAAGKKHKLIKITGVRRTAKRASVHAKDLSLWERL
jgi:hypothetical protein